MFRRRRREQPDQVAEQDAAAPTRESGPWDADEPHPDTDRIDLGGLRLPHNPDFDVRLASVGDQHVGVVVLYEESSLQLQALAAPKTMGLWDEVRSKIKGTATDLTEREGPFGPELTGEISNDGQTRKARYIGIDGPRWFLLAMISGRAALDEAVAGAFLDFVRDVVVVRGTEPMAREEAITLRRPNEQQSAETNEPPALNPFKRGPEISEIR
ncbi:DUF3710 domain-containing protein [Nonomuraea rhizosphaerae]|uniref:DUF3710 domain-containing protein n=1 Tax=Nonomuraea rhizosphaerae TaxID=2665663 RepID=UPI0027E3A9FB|nr:DUF3710 domain-containing protein [Nonomuraea rhizosphaerae]